MCDDPITEIIIVTMTIMIDVDDDDDDDDDDVSDDGADNRLAQFCTQVKPFGNKTFCSRYFDIFQCECYIRMQM